MLGLASYLAVAAERESADVGGVTEEEALGSRLGVLGDDGVVAHKHHLVTARAPGQRAHMLPAHTDHVMQLHQRIRLQRPALACS